MSVFAPHHEGVEQRIPRRDDVVVGEAHAAEAGLVGGDLAEEVERTVADRAGELRESGVEYDELLDSAASSRGRASLGRGRCTPG